MSTTSMVPSESVLENKPDILCLGDDSVSPRMVSAVGSLASVFSHECLQCIRQVVVVKVYGYCRVQIVALGMRGLVLRGCPILWTLVVRREVAKKLVFL